MNDTPTDVVTVAVEVLRRRYGLTEDDALDMIAISSRVKTAVSPASRPG